MLRNTRTRPPCPSNDGARPDTVRNVATADLTLTPRRGYQERYYTRAVTFALSAASGRGWRAVQLPVGNVATAARALTPTIHPRLANTLERPRILTTECPPLQARLPVDSGLLPYTTLRIHRLLHYSCLEYRPLETPSATSGPPGDSRGCPCLGICSLTLSPGRGSAHSLKCSIGCGWQLAYHRCHTYNQIEALATTRARPTATFGLPRSPTWLTTNSYICNTVRNVATAYNISRVGGNSRIPDCT